MFRKKQTIQTQVEEKTNCSKYRDLFKIYRFESKNPTFLEWMTAHYLSFHVYINKNGDIELSLERRFLLERDLCLILKKDCSDNRKIISDFIENLVFRLNTGNMIPIKEDDAKSMFIWRCNEELSVRFTPECMNCILFFLKEHGINL